MFFSALSVQCPFLAHVHFDSRNTVYGGLGLGYELELLNIQPKYEDSRFLYQNLFYLENRIGYEFYFNERFNLFTDLTAEYHFIESSFVNLKIGFGINFNLFKEQI